MRYSLCGARPMVVAVYGGSFNPPHIGHGMVAMWALWSRMAEAVWWVPVAAHAFDKTLLPFSERVGLLQALIEDLAPPPGSMVISTVEADRDGPNYTLETLMALANAHPQHRFRWVMGADNLADLPRWHRYEALAAQFDPLVVGRVGWPPVEGAPTFPEISASAVRERLLRGQPVDHLLTPSVRQRCEALWPQRPERVDP